MSSAWFCQNLQSSLTSDAQAFGDEWGLRFLIPHHQQISILPEHFGISTCISFVGAQVGNGDKASTTSDKRRHETKRGSLVAQWLTPVRGALLQKQKENSAHTSDWDNTTEDWGFRFHWNWCDWIPRTFVHSLCILEDIYFYQQNCPSSISLGEHLKVPFSIMTACSDGLFMDSKF